MITKKDLEQYSDLLEEIVDVENKILRLEDDILRLTESGTVKDSVLGGEGGIQKFNIEGIPVDKIRQKKTMLYTRKMTLELLQSSIDEKQNEIEEFISTIDDSRVRRIVNYKYIERLSWNAVADRMGGGNTEDGVRKTLDRYLLKNNS